MRIEGELKLRDYDPGAAAGYLKPDIQELSGIVVEDGSLDIEFIRKRRFPKISAIEILPDGEGGR